METKRTTLKPTMPKPAPTINLSGIKAKLMFDMEKYSSGKTAFTYSDTERIIKDEKGVKIGSVIAAMGGGIVVKVGERDWGIDMEALFYAVKEAEQMSYIME